MNNRAIWHDPNFGKLVLLCKIRRKTVIPAGKRVSSAMDGEHRTIHVAWHRAYLDGFTASFDGHPGDEFRSAMVIGWGEESAASFAINAVPVFTCIIRNLFYLSGLRLDIQPLPDYDARQTAYPFLLGFLDITDAVVEHAAYRHQR